MKKKLNIPNLKTLEKDLIEVVKEMQGEKGYVDTSTDECDTIYAIMFDEQPFPVKEYTLIEKKINRIKVEDDDLFFCTEDAVNAESVTEEDIWIPLNSEMVEYYSTLFSIVDNIEQYKD